MARVFTHREFKLLLNPERFPTKRSVLEFNDLLAKIAAERKVHYDEFETINSQVRTVQFFDTEDQDFRRNHIILRLRQDRSSGWPDETFEVTFKCRSSDYQESADFDVGSTAGLREKRKFKEEILRGDEVGTIRRIFSNNNVAVSPIKNFSAPMSRIIEIFPALSSLKLDPSKTVSVVNNAKVFEIEAKLGTYFFGKDALAPAGLAVWTRPTTDAFHVLVAEFGFSYHVLGSNPKQQDAHEAADKFFKQLQPPLKDWLFEGSTKTALIYGVEES
jgi:hypothetical protein